MYNYLTKNKAFTREGKTKNKQKKKEEEDVFAGKSAIYVKHFQTKEI